MAAPEPVVSLRMPTKLLRRLDAIAEHHSLSRSHVVLLALSALALPNGRAHREFNELRERFDRATRWR